MVTPSFLRLSPLSRGILFFLRRKPLRPQQWRGYSTIASHAPSLLFHRVLTTYEKGHCYLGSVHPLFCTLPILDDQITLDHLFMKDVSQSIAIHGVMVTPFVIPTVKCTSLFLLCWLTFALRQDHHTILHPGL